MALRWFSGCPPYTIVSTFNKLRPFSQCVGRLALVLGLCGGALAVALCAQAPSPAATSPTDVLAQAHEMHRALMAKPADERTPADYQQIVDLLAPAAADSQSPDADSARFEAASIDLDEARDLNLHAAYDLAAEQFLTLLHEHPYTAFRRNAEWALAQIQIFYLHEPRASAEWLRDFVQRYPADPRVPAARKELAGETIPLPAILPGDPGSGAAAPPTEAMAKLDAAAGIDPQQPAPAPPPAPALPPAPVLPQAPMPAPSANHRDFDVHVGPIEGIQVWESPASTSIIFGLHASVHFERATLKELHVVYFDLPIRAGRGRSAATPHPAVVSVNDGRVNSIRIAQTRPGVLRVVVDTAPGMSVDAGHVFPNPWRLVVSVKPVAAPAHARERR